MQKIIKGIPLNFIKLFVVIFVIVTFIILIKRFLTKNSFRKIEPFKSLLSVFAIVLIFYIGLFYSSKDGNAFYIALYPLYVVIFVATFASIKKRSHHIIRIKREYLQKELIWGSFLALISFLLLIVMNVKQYLASGIILAFNFLFIGYLFNLALIFLALKNKKES